MTRWHKIKDVRKLIPVRASVLRRGYVLGHSLRSVCRPHGGIAGCRLCVRTCCRTSSRQLFGRYVARPHTLCHGPRNYRGIGETLLREGGGRTACQNEPRYNSALIECYSYLGYYYLLKSDYATSKEYWNKILAIDPTNATANRALDGIK